MAEFPDSVKKQALERAKYRCECTRKTCDHHSGRCPRKSDLEAHHRIQAVPNILSNCEILCHDCHENTHSYGRS